MVFFPLELPNPLRDRYAIEYVSSVVQSPVELGPPKTRLRSSWYGPKFTGTWRLNDAQFHRFEVWWTREIGQGTLPFYWYEPLRGRPGKYLLTAAPRISLERSATAVDVTLEGIALEEYWPGRLQRDGANVYVWDPRWHVNQTLQVGDGRTRVLRFRDRINGAELVASAAMMPFLEQDGTQWFHRADNNEGFRENAGPVIAFDNQHMLFALAFTRRADGKRTLLSLHGTKQSDGTSLIYWYYQFTNWEYAQSMQRIDVAFNYNAADMTRCALVMHKNGNTMFRYIGNTRYAETDVATEPAASMRNVTAYVHWSANEGANGFYYGLVIAGGRPFSDAERLLVTRWASIMAGRVPD